MENEQNKVQKSLNERKSNKKIALGAIMGYVYLAIQIISGVLFIPLISKHYGQDQYGLITLSNTFVNLLMTDIGISAIACRFLSQARAKGDQIQIRSLMALLYKIYALLSIVIFVVLFVMFFFIENIFIGLTPAEIDSFKEIYIVMSISSVLVFAMQGFEGVLNAYEEYAAVRILNIVQRLLYIVFVSLALAFNWSIVSIALITASTNLICSISKYFLIRFKDRLKADFKNKVPKDFIKNISVYAIWQIMISVLARLNNNLASPILGVVSDSKNISIYGVALQLETYAFYVSNVLGGLFVPKIARIFAENNSEESNRRIFELATKIAVIMSAISLLLIVGFISCGQEFITLWMNDPGYDLSYICTIILMVSQILYAPNVVFRSAMYFNNNIKYLFVGSVSSFIVFLILSFTLGYFYGAVGMCFAVGASTLVKTAIQYVFFGLRLNANIGKYLNIVFLKQLPIVVLTSAVGLLIHFFVPLDDLSRLLIIIPSVAVPYLLYSWFIVINSSLRKSLMSLFRK